MKLVQRFELKIAKAVFFVCITAGVSCFDFFIVKTPRFD